VYEVKQIIYLYIDPRNNNIFYVGKSAVGCRRAYNIYAHKSYCSNVINKLKRLGLRPIVKILQSFNNIAQNDLCEAEKYWISYFKNIGYKLTNCTDGGEGTIGYKHTIESRRIMSAKSRRSKGFKGKTHNSDSKLRNRLAHLGKKLSEEHKKKVGLFFKNKQSHRKGKSISQNHIDNIKNGNKKRIVIKCLSDELVFNSARDAANYYKTGHATILRCCRDGKEYNGLRFVLIKEGALCMK